MTCLLSGQWSGEGRRNGLGVVRLSLSRSRARSHSSLEGSVVSQRTGGLFGLFGYLAPTG